MLVLTRKATEFVCIGNDITIEVRRVAGNRVSLAISAPKHVSIVRGELVAKAKLELERIENEHEAREANRGTA